jgi:uncharacterized membrane protein
LKIELLLQWVLRIGLFISLIPLVIGGMMGSPTWQQYGILILLLTPLFRNISSAILYLYQHDYLFALITLSTVLIILFT